MPPNCTTSTVQSVGSINTRPLHLSSPLHWHCSLNNTFNLYRNLWMWIPWCAASGWKHLQGWNKDCLVHFILYTQYLITTQSYTSQANSKYKKWLTKANWGSELNYWDNKAGLSTDFRTKHNTAQITPVQKIEINDLFWQSERQHLQLFSVRFMIFRSRQIN